MSRITRKLKNNLNWTQQCREAASYRRFLRRWSSLRLSPETERELRETLCADLARGYDEPDQCSVWGHALRPMSMDRTLFVTRYEERELVLLSPTINIRVCRGSRRTRRRLLRQMGTRARRAT